MRNDRATIYFEPVTEAHLPMLRRWLGEPHMREWWGDPEEELGFVRDMVEGRDTTRPFLIMLDGEPLGYIQCWFLDDHQNEAWLKDHSWLAELPPGTVGVDLSIGDPARLSRGIGSAALKAFVGKLVNEGFRSIIIDPDPANLRAVRAFMKAGFRPVPYLEGRTGDALIMLYDTRAQELTI